jgi:hypothetical protein
MIDLSELDVLIEDLSFDYTDKEINQIYEVFKRDFIDNPVVIDGKAIKIILAKSKIPEFKAYPETFVHIVTRKNLYSGKRNFEPERANRIHWIKEILLQKNDSRIKYFEWLDENRIMKEHYWYEEGKFMVILKKVSKDLMIVTAFCVDEIEKRKYKYRYEQYQAGI